MKRTDAEYALAKCLIFLRQLRDTGILDYGDFDLQDILRMLDEILDKPTSYNLEHSVHSYKGEFRISKHVN